MNARMMFARAGGECCQWENVVKSNTNFQYAYDEAAADRLGTGNIGIGNIGNWQHSPLRLRR